MLMSNETNIIMKTTDKLSKTNLILMIRFRSTTILYRYNLVCMYIRKPLNINKKTTKNLTEKCKIK